MKSVKKQADPQSIYQLDSKIKISQGIPFALQQVLSMFLSNITPAILITAVALYDGKPLTNIQIAIIFQNSMLVAGIGTLIQALPLWKFGAKLPIIMGISFNFLVAAMAIAAQDYGYLIGAVIIGGIIEGTLGLFYKYWGKFITPLTSACVVIAIGFSIIGSACTSLASSPKFESGSWQNIIVGLITMLSAITFFLLGKGIFKQLYLLFALIIGYIVALPFGMVDFSGFKETVSTLGIVTYPHIFQYKPKFQLSSIITISIIFLTSAAETVGDISALVTSTMNRSPTEKEIKGGLACDGFISAISGGFFGCTPITSFSGQIGTVIMTKIINRYVCVIEAVILIIAGLCPPIGALLTTVPDCVLGGVSIIAFGSILISGFQMLAKVGFNERNSLIAAVSLTLGLGSTLCANFYQRMPALVQDIFANNPIAGVFVFTVLLSAIFPAKKQK